MGLSQKKLQKKRDKKKSKHKRKQKSQRNRALESFGNAGIAKALDYPVYDCFQAEDLFDCGVGYVVVSRKAGNKVLSAFFLLDVYCMGIKDAFVSILPEIKYDRAIQEVDDNQGIKMVDPAYARKLVEDAEEYARSIGLEPHKDYAQSSKIFGDIDSSDCSVSFKFGKGGKPLFMPGPHDSPARCQQIIKTLSQHLDADAFHYIAPVVDDSFPVADLEMAINIEDSLNDALDMMSDGKLKHAESKIKRLLKKHPEHAKVQFAMGVLFVYQGDTDKALPYFDEAIEISPDFVEAHYNKAVVHQGNMELLEMLESYQKVIQIGEAGEYFVQNAQSFLDDFSENIRETEEVDLQTYMKALEIFDAAFVQMREKNFEEAIELFQQSIELSPRNPKPYGNIGGCYAQMGEKQLALEALDQALEIDPDYEFALMNRAFVERGMTEGEAISEMKTFKGEEELEENLEKKGMASFFSRFF